MFCSCVSSPNTVGHERVCACILATRLDRKLLTPNVVIKLNSVENARSAHVRCHTAFFVQLARVLNYSETSVEEYGLPFLRSSITDIVMI